MYRAIYEIRCTACDLQTLPAHPVEGDDLITGKFDHDVTATSPKSDMYMYMYIIPIYGI